MCVCVCVCVCVGGGGGSHCPLLSACHDLGNKHHGHTPAPCATGHDNLVVCKIRDTTASAYSKYWFTTS